MGFGSYWGWDKLLSHYWSCGRGNGFCFVGTIFIIEEWYQNCPRKLVNNWQFQSNLDSYQICVKSTAYTYYKQKNSHHFGSKECYHSKKSCQKSFFTIRKPIELFSKFNKLNSIKTRNRLKKIIFKAVIVNVVQTFYIEKPFLVFLHT